MSKLFEKILADLKQAMLSKNAELTSTLRMLVAALRNKEITLRENGKAELSDEQAVEVVAGEIKKRHDSVAAYTQGGRPELADKEAKEIKLLEIYLPAQLDNRALEKIIKEIIAAGTGDFGKVMGQAMARVKGQADGKRVGEIVKKLLASK